MYWFGFRNYNKLLLLYNQLMNDYKELLDSKVQLDKDYLNVQRERNDLQLTIEIHKHLFNINTKTIQTNQETIALLKSNMNEVISERDKMKQLIDLL